MTKWSQLRPGKRDYFSHRESFKAIREHECDACTGLIRKGEKHWRISHISHPEDVLTHKRFHLECLLTEDLESR